MSCTTRAVMTRFPRSQADTFLSVLVCCGTETGDGGRGGRDQRQVVVLVASRESHSTGQASPALSNWMPFSCVSASFCLKKAAEALFMPAAPPACTPAAALPAS